MVIVVAAVIYDGSIFYSRWSHERELERARARNEAEEARRTVELLGGNDLRILNFYASPGVIPSGASATICYGVNSAKKVRLEPPVEELWPALSHCFQVAPRKDTEYKLFAEDAAGHAVSQSLLLRVRR